MSAKLRIDVSQGILEVEGSETFVQAIYNDFKLTLSNAVKPNRATIVMCWILVQDHLIDLVLQKHLAEFNACLALVKDRRVKVSTVTVRDDFGDIPEGKFIELLRSSKIISNDVRKILDEKLGTRNSCAHASGIIVKPSKVIDFVSDLIENVILKYPH
jgi:hypothetical protein